MSSEGTKAPLAGTDTSGAAEETERPETRQRPGEGIGVFRALIITALIYAVLGFLIWFAWDAFFHVRGH
jgi:hypothetical protein